MNLCESVLEQAWVETAELNVFIDNSTLHGEEQFVSADAGYQGAPQREELAEVDVCLLYTSDAADEDISV